MKSRLRIVLILGVLGILTSLLAILPAFAVQGEVSALDVAGGDDITWSHPGATIFVQVADSDLNVAVPVLNEEIDYGTPCLANGDLKTAQVANVPILDSAGSSSVNFEDVVLGGSANVDTTVFSADANNGIITLRCAGAGAATTQFVNYEAPGANTVDAADFEITSDADEVGITLELSEIDPDDGTAAANSGVFGSLLELCSDAGCSDNTANPPAIQVATDVNDTVTISYDDPDDSKDSVIVRVEGNVSEYSNFSPADGWATTQNRPTLSGDVTDSDSGVLQDDDTESIMVVIRLTDLDGVALAGDPRDTLNVASLGQIVATTGGFSASQRVPSGLTPTEDEYLIQWWITAEDVAGNLSVSDQDDDTACNPALFDVDGAFGHVAGEVVGDCDPYEIRVDFVDPSIVSATTGNWLDPDADPELQTGTDAINTSIQVVFDEDLNCDTVSAADFDSEDVDIDDVDCDGASVFLTVDAMDADDEPEILLVGAVQDEAGNDEDEDDVNADDGLPATLSVAVTGTGGTSRPVTDEEITITVTSDETLTGSPQVFVYGIDAAVTTEGANLADGEITLTDTRTWEAAFDLDSAGLYNVYVQGTDLGAGITASEGEDGSAVATVIDLDDAILFEVDNAIPDPVFRPEPETSLDSDETEETSPFITVDFAAEGSEYTPEDEHSTVAITSATLDGDDIVFQSEDDILYLYRASNLSEGEHEVVLTYEDEAGNLVEDAEFTFEVIAREPFTVDLLPGWNLISIPGNPVGADLNDIVPADLPVDAVMGPDASNPGAFVTAIRNADGSWPEFELRPNSGYWVSTSSFEDLEVDIPALGAMATPPQPFDVLEGWNLIGVTTLAPDGFASTADDYFGDNWARAYEYNTRNGRYEVVASGEAVTPGVGYWVFYTEAGQVVP